LTEQSPLQIPTAKRAVGLFRVLIILSLTILAVYICYLLVLPFARARVGVGINFIVPAGS
jgi:uncharacterized membrane protein (DUF485 family)